MSEPTLDKKGALFSQLKLVIVNQEATNCCLLSYVAFLGNIMSNLDLFTRNIPSNCSRSANEFNAVQGLFGSTVT